MHVSCGCCLWEEVETIFEPCFHARTGSSKGSGRARTGPVEKGTGSLPSRAVSTLMTVSASRKPSISRLPTEPQVLRSRYWDVTRKRTEKAALGEDWPLPMPFCHISCSAVSQVVPEGASSQTSWQISSLNKKAEDQISVQRLPCRQHKQKMQSCQCSWDAG